MPTTPCQACDVDLYTLPAFEQAFRHDCLVRLYVGYLLYTLTVRLNSAAVFRDLSFEHWYMFYFNDLQLWERQKVALMAGRGAATPLTNLISRLCRTGGSQTGRRNAAISSTIVPTYGEQLLVSEIIDRVADLAGEHWYVLDIGLASRNALDRMKAADHRDFHGWLPWKHDLNRTVYMVTRNPAARLAPAPFCCINDDDFFRQNYDESTNMNEPYARSFSIPLSLFFHRLYVNMDMHFGNRKDLHMALAKYLPDLYDELQEIHLQERESRRIVARQDRQRQQRIAAQRIVPSLGGI